MLLEYPIYAYEQDIYRWACAFDAVNYFRNW